MPKQACDRSVADSGSEPPQPTMTNGNVPLRMNSDLGLAFEEFVTRATQGTRECKDIPSDPSVSCIEDIANLVFPQFAPGGLFNSLLKLAILMPQKDIKPIVPYVQATRTSAAVSNLGLNSGSLVSVVKLVCWLLYDWLSDSHPSPSIWDIPASALVNETSTATTPTSSALPCPTGMFTLDYEYCNGNPVTKKCGGLKNGQWKGCPYNPPPLPAYAPYASKLALQQALQKLWSYAPDQYNLDASISTSDQPGLGIYRVQFKQQVSPVDNFT